MQCHPGRVVHTADDGGVIAGREILHNRRLQIEFLSEFVGLPEGSVRLHLPSGRPARADKSIDAFLDDYDRG